MAIIRLMAQKKKENMRSCVRGLRFRRFTYILSYICVCYLSYMYII